MDKKNLVFWLIIAVVTVVAIFVEICFFNAVIASDFPDWAKYLLLRG